MFLTLSTERRPRTCYRGIRSIIVRIVLDVWCIKWFSISCEIKKKRKRDGEPKSMWRPYDDHEFMAIFDVISILYSGSIYFVRVYIINSFLPLSVCSSCVRVVCVVESVITDRNSLRFSSFLELATCDYARECTRDVLTNASRKGSTCLVSIHSRVINVLQGRARASSA